MYLLGIDLGTTGCKSMVFDAQGSILGDHYIEYNLIFTPDGVEQDADEWWLHTRTAIRAAIAKAGIDGRQIAGLSVSSQGIAFVPVDRSGNTLMNAISWYDARAGEEAARLREDYDMMDLCGRTGRCPGSLVFTQVMWLKKNRPEVYEKTWKFLMGMDFLLYRLCGAAATDYSMASGTLCYDIAERSWIGSLFDRYGIDQGKFPAIGCHGDTIGTVLPEVAVELGLSDKARVVLGLQDQKCAALGAGIDEGMVTVSLGTASAISSLTGQPLLDRSQQLFCHGFDRRRWILESCVATSGAALKWVRNSFFPDLTYAAMDSLAEAAPPGARGMFFYPLLSPGKRTSMPGLLAGMSLDSTRGDIARSVLEGIAFEIAGLADAHRTINEQVKHGDSLRVFGGGAASPVWCQIIADITGDAVLVPQTRETGCLGAGMCAGVGAGLYRDFSEARKHFVQIRTRYEPDKYNHAKYREIRSRYEALRQKFD